jgi:hypothetical protein
MTVENTLNHGLKTSAPDSDYKVEQDQNLAALDPNRISVGTFANRPAAGTANRFYFTIDTFIMYWDNGVTWDTVGPLLDEDDMISNSNTQASTQQAIGAYIAAILTPKKNLLINGGFTINQRVYVSGATLASGSFGHDRMKGGASGGDYTFTQLESNTEITILSSKSLIQIVRDKNVVGGTYTLSWTGTAQARFGIDSSTPSGAYANSPITINSQTAGTVMSVEFDTGTLGVMQLNEGVNANPFEYRHYEKELELCIPYAEELMSGLATGIICQGGASTTALGICMLSFSPKITNTPVVTVSSAAHFEIVYGTSTAALDSLVPGLETKNTCRLTGSATGSPMTATQDVQIRSVSTSASILVTDELT